jgi:nicotinamide-nucleotide amidase
MGEQTLAQVVGEQLAATGKTLAVAESCTGGLVAKMLTDIPGSSQYFTCGWVTYSNEAKIRDLGVPADLLDTYGAVSEQVARAMARGARHRACADYAIGITGIAGPSGGTVNKPLGLVFIGVDGEKACTAERFQFSRDRHFIRQRAAQTALNMVRLRLGL